MRLLGLTTEALKFAPEYPTVHSGVVTSAMTMNVRR